MAIENRSVTGHWRQVYFGAYVRSLIGDGSIFLGERFVDEDSGVARHRLETELCSELSELWDDLYEQNPVTLQQRTRATLSSSSEYVELDPPVGIMPCGWRDICEIEDTRITSGNRNMRHVPAPYIHEFGGASWCLDGRRLIVRTGHDRRVGETFDVDIVFIAEPTPIDLSSDMPYLTMPANCHHVIATGAAVRLIDKEDPNFQSLFRSYATSRSRLLRANAHYQQKGEDVYDTGIDFSLTRI